MRFEEQMTPPGTLSRLGLATILLGAFL